MPLEFLVFGFGRVGVEFLFGVWGHWLPVNWDFGLAGLRGFARMPIHAMSRMNGHPAGKFVAERVWMVSVTLRVSGSFAAFRMTARTSNGKNNNDGDGKNNSAGKAKCGGPPLASLRSG
jgi:hypothetical protein